MSGYRSPFRALGTYFSDSASANKQNSGTVSTVDLSQTQVGLPFVAGGRCLNVSSQFEVTSGTPNGTLYVDATNDPRITDAAFQSLVVWEPVEAVAFTGGLSPVGPGGGQTNGTIIVVQNGVYALRVRWVPTGTTAGQGWATMYGVGALQ